MKRCCPASFVLAALGVDREGEGADSALLRNAVLNKSVSKVLCVYMYAEKDCLPISALQHLIFCRRQCALIHLEQMWSENRFTAEGRNMHDRVHELGADSRGDIRIVRGLRLRSLQLGLTGVADVVEFHRSENGTEVPGIKGRWSVFPVEYKRGKPKSNGCDRIQLCAQALCLEELLECKIAGGALFYGSSKRRQAVAFDDGLRENTVQAAVDLHRLINAGVTPPAIYGKKCKQCSLLNECMPQLFDGHVSAVAYLARQIDTVLNRSLDNADILAEKDVL